MNVFVSMFVHHKQKEGRRRDILHPIKVFSGNRSSGAAAEVAGAFAMQKAGVVKDDLCPGKVISDDALGEPAAKEVSFGSNSRRRRRCPT